MSLVGLKKAAWISIKIVKISSKIFSYDREFNRGIFKAGPIQFSWRLPIDLTKASELVRVAVYKAVQAEFAAWANATFPDGANEGILNHLKEEIGELENATTLEDKMHEAADVYMLIMDYAQRNGFSLYDAYKAKFAIVKTRQYGPKNQLGYQKHL